MTGSMSDSVAKDRAIAFFGAHSTNCMNDHAAASAAPASGSAVTSDLSPIDEGGTGRAIPLHDEEGFAAMRRAGELAARTLDHVTPFVKPGVSTQELDDIIDAFMRDHDGVPATLGYRGYPKSSCISVNHVVNHGIPSAAKKLAKADIVNIDVTVILDGWYGDTSRMYVAGQPKSFAAKLIQVTHDALFKGIEAVRPGNTFGDIGKEIQSFVEAKGMSVVRDFCGHGLGRVFHAPPNVLHYGRAGTGARLEEGMFFTIEPMVNLGRPETKVLADDWTAVTCDKSLSAQFEHSVGVTADGCELFTLSPAGRFHPTRG